METTLYLPVKRFLEGLGFQAKGEVCGCDVVALDKGTPAAVVIAELKLGFSLDLVLQAVDRLPACDEVWLLTCSPRAQHERLIRRGSTPADAAQRIAAQGDIVRRIRGMVGRVIDSSSDPTTTRQDVERAMEDALQAARP